MLELWEMQSTPSLPLLPGSLWHREVAPELFEIEQFFYIKSMYLC